MTKKLNKTLTKKELEKLANDLYFKIDDKQMNNLLIEFETILQQMAFVQKINTDNVSPLNYPFLVFEKSYLHDDVPRKPLSQNAVLTLAPKTHKDYIIINRVIKNED